MTFLIDWLSKNKKLNIVILSAYFVAVVLPHKKFGTFLNTVVFKGITRDQYNLYVALASGFVLLIISLIFLKNSKSSVSRNILWFYMVCTILLSIIVLNLLFVINIEVIHFPQYALFAILAFPLINNYTSTLIWSTLFGSLDEAYQYFYLAPSDTGYFDFNDVITNLIGAALGLIFLRSFGVNSVASKPFFKTSWFKGLLGLTLFIALLFIFDILSYYPEDEIPYSILKGKINGFWSIVVPNVKYHVVRPLEGLMITFLLWLFYSGLDYFQNNH